VTRRAAAILQALFALGCLQLVVKLLRVSTSSAVALGLSAGLAVLAGLGLWAAVALWRGKPAGAVLTLVLQAVHLVYLETASLSIAISLPIAIVVGLDGGFHPHSWLAWKPSIEITVETLDQSPWIGVNLLALFSAGVAVFELRRALREAGVLGKAPAAL
jgi:hypothetical protein